MRKLYLEILAAIFFVAFATLFVYRELDSVAAFWDTQQAWNIALMICWVIVSFGYFHQGWIVRKAGSASHVSQFLPRAVFVVQCILFVKGIHYRDWSLTAGAVVVNSGVVFSLYHIYKARHIKPGK